MYNTIPQLLIYNKENYESLPAQYSKDKSGVFQPTSHKELYNEVLQLASGLKKLGVGKETPVGLISENRKEWLICDLAIMFLRAADVPRGCDTTTQELSYILSFTSSPVVFLENRRQLEKIISIKDSLPDLKHIVMFDMPENDYSSEIDVPVMSFENLMALGSEHRAEYEADITAGIAEAGGEEMVTIIFTSGTTGTPKGVMLSHRNFLHQVEGVPKLLNLETSDKWLCVLPVWHSFERIMQYVAMGAASALCYSKPVGKIMLADFQSIHPTWMASVPRIWESLKTGIYRKINAGSPVSKALFHFFVGVGAAYKYQYNKFNGLLPEFKKRSMFLEKMVSIIPMALLFPLFRLGDALIFKKIRKSLGGSFVAGISGGGALPEACDKFFSAVGILLLEGYGLTETAPVLGVRAQDHPVTGTVGPVFPGTEIQILDEKGVVLPPGNKGVVMARGPQVMLGYYKEPEKTRAIINEEGWLNTGDLGMLTWNNELKIMGRVKDTIVLLGGENIEPSPIEKKLCESDYVEQAVLLGQDKKFLAVLIVPVMDMVVQYAADQNISYMNKETLLDTPEIQDWFKEIVSEQISSKNGFKSFEKIYRFKLLGNSFEIGRELSGKQEVKRHAVYKLYDAQIKALFE